MAENGKYYWLKLKRDFFKRHDIRFIEEMPNGKDYILFYLKLLLESIDHEGSLRFSDTIPYNEMMLSVVTNTNVDIVRSAMKLFIELNMMQVLEDQTIFMNEVDKLIGGETKWAEKKRLQRAKEDNVPQLSQKCPTELESYKELNKEKESDISISGTKRPRFVPPTVEEVKIYCQERGNLVNPERFVDYYTANGWQVGKTKMKDWKAAVRTWEKNGYSNQSDSKNKSYDVDDFFEASLARTQREFEHSF